MTAKVTQKLTQLLYMHFKGVIEIFAWVTT